MLAHLKSETKKQKKGQNNKKMSGVRVEFTFEVEIWIVEFERNSLMISMSEVVLIEHMVLSFIYLK